MVTGLTMSEINSDSCWVRQSRYNIHSFAFMKASMWVKRGLDSSPELSFRIAIYLTVSLNAALPTFPTSSGRHLTRHTFPWPAETVYLLSWMYPSTLCSSFPNIPQGLKFNTHLSPVLRERGGVSHSSRRGSRINCWIEICKNSGGFSLETFVGCHDWLLRLLYLITCLNERRLSSMFQTKETILSKYKKD